MVWGLGFAVDGLEGSHGHHVDDALFKFLVENEEIDPFFWISEQYSGVMLIKQRIEWLSHALICISNYIWWIVKAETLAIDHMCYSYSMTLFKVFLIKMFNGL
jgi:hypothetical protein